MPTANPGYGCTRLYQTRRAPNWMVRGRFAWLVKAEAGLGGLRVRGRERGVIRHVACLETKLEVLALREAEILQERSIPVVDAVPPDIRERGGECPDVEGER
jgi:hypothetical protein